MAKTRTIYLNDEDDEWLSKNGGVSQTIRKLIANEINKTTTNQIDGALDDLGDEDKFYSLPEEKRKEIELWAYKDDYSKHCSEALAKKYPALKKSWVNHCIKIAKRLGFLNEKAKE